MDFNSCYFSFVFGLIKNDSHVVESAPSILQSQVQTLS